MHHQKYVVVTPARNEEAYLPLVITSMRSQTVKPWRWILVDDGSSDNTGAIIDRAASENPWILAVHRVGLRSRQAGGGVIASFYDGYKLIEHEEYDYISKFDGDLSFGPDYFQRCLQEFESNPRLGIAGGTCCLPLDTGLQPEFSSDPRFHVRGPTKIYRRECWEAIGGLIVAPGWDTVDEIKANMLGWQTCTFKHIGLTHHRPTGGAYGAWSTWIKNGLANYITGYHPFFMLCKCVRRLFRKPYGVQGIGLAIGFMKGWITKLPRVNDTQMIRYLHRQQFLALTLRHSLWR
jgi:glycosyltransferase involved in cell wall biosynthesis